MDKFKFDQLCHSLERFECASHRWSGILLSMIYRCEGFMEQYTLDEQATDTFLVEKTAELLEQLPVTASDEQIADLLSREFEGYHFIAQTPEGNWNSLTEPFKEFHHYNPDADIYINDLPHAPSLQFKLHMMRMIRPDYTEYA